MSGLRITIDPVACDAYGYCAELLPEAISLDEWGYPDGRRTGPCRQSWWPWPSERCGTARSGPSRCGRRRAVHDRPLPSRCRLRQTSAWRVEEYSLDGKAAMASSPSLPVPRPE